MVPEYGLFNGDLIQPKGIVHNPLSKVRDHIKCP